MRIEQLQYITAVTQHGSLRKASETLHISQPALSEAVSRLERELGVTLLDRRRSGARISRQGRDLLQNMTEVLEAVARLRNAAGDQHHSARMVRIGTVSAATSTLLVPAVRALKQTHPSTTVELVDAQQPEILQGLVEGALDLGLVNLLDGDDTPADVEATTLTHGRPVAVLPADHPLTALPEVTVEDLREHDMVVMRAGYLMHRFVHRLFGTALPPLTVSTDGAEMGKVMVAQGVGATVLPDYSVVGDPLERAGLITHRPIRHATAGIRLVLLRRRGDHVPAAVRDLGAALVEQSRR